MLQAIGPKVGEGAAEAHHQAVFCQKLNKIKLGVLSVQRLTEPLMEAAT